MDMKDAFSGDERTRVDHPIHYGGFVCDMDSLMKFARQRKIKVVEDAAHAYGSSYKGRKVGTLGDATCFSFDPIKNITCGEGGAVTTDDDPLAARITTKRILVSTTTRGAAIATSATGSTRSLLRASDTTCRTSTRRSGSCSTTDERVSYS